MKMLVAGNLVNHGYYLVKLLRKQGLDVDLFLQKFPEKSDDPKNFDSDLKEYPKWIKFWNNKKSTWKFEIIQKMRNYDLIQSSTELPIFTMFSGKPFISYTTGSDIIELAHQNNLKGFLLRRAYKQSKIVVFAALYMYPSIEKLKIRNSIFLPILWDYEKFSQSNENNVENEKMIIFHPTRHDWAVKGNDRLMKAYVKLAHKRNDVHLITINHDIDAKKSLQILKDGNIEGKYTILPKSLTQNELQEYYQKIDVVADYFVLGSIGLIGQEAMACEKPLVNYIDEKLFEKFYGEVPPILNCKTEEEIYNALERLVTNRKMIKEVGQKSRRWLLKHHDPERIIKKYIKLYECVNKNMNVNEIKKELEKM